MKRASGASHSAAVVKGEEMLFKGDSGEGGKTNRLIPPIPKHPQIKSHRNKKNRINDVLEAARECWSDILTECL